MGKLSFGPEPRSNKQANKQIKGKIAPSKLIWIRLCTVLLLSFFMESYNHCGWQSAFNSSGDKFHSPSKMELTNKPATTFNNEFQIGDLKYYHSSTAILWRWEHSTLHLINALKLNKRGGELIFFLDQSFKSYTFKFKIYQNGTSQQTSHNIQQCILLKRILSLSTQYSQTWH